MRLGVLSPQMQAAVDGTVNSLWAALDRTRESLDDASSAGVDTQALDAQFSSLQRRVKELEAMSADLDDREYPAWERPAATLLEEIAQLAVSGKRAAVDVAKGSRYGALLWGAGAVGVAALVVVLMNRYRSAQ